MSNEINLANDPNQQEIDTETKDLVDQGVIAGHLPIEDETSFKDTCVRSIIAYLHEIVQSQNNKHFLARVELQQQLMRQRLSFPERLLSGVLDPEVAELARGEGKQVEVEVEYVIELITVPEAKAYATTLVEALNEMMAVTTKFKQGALEVAAETRLADQERRGRLA